MSSLHLKLNIAWNDDTVNMAIDVLDKELQRRNKSERLLTTMQEKDLLAEIRLLFLMSDGGKYTKEDFKTPIAEMFGWEEIVDLYIYRRIVNPLINKKYIIRIEESGKVYYSITQKGLKRIE